MSHAIEQKWIEYWNELHDLLKTHNTEQLIDENNQTLSLESAQQLIQDEVYKGNDITFQTEERNGVTKIKIITIFTR